MKDLIHKNLLDTQDVYSKRIALVYDVAAKETLLTDARRVLEAAKTKILVSVDPKELGGNEATRLARIAELTSLEAEQVNILGKIVETMKSQAEMLRLESRRCELTLQHFSLLCDGTLPQGEGR